MLDLVGRVGQLVPASVAQGTARHVMRAADGRGVDRPLMTKQTGGSSSPDAEPGTNLACRIVGYDCAASASTMATMVVTAYPKQAAGVANTRRS